MQERLARKLEELHYVVIQAADPGGPVGLIAIGQNHIRLIKLHQAPPNLPGPASWRSIKEMLGIHLHLSGVSYELWTWDSESEHWRIDDLQ